MFVDLLEKVFDMDFLQKHFWLNSPYRVTRGGGSRRKNTAEKQKKTATKPKAQERQGRQQKLAL
jgi:hypothetical protein